MSIPATVILNNLNDIPLVGKTKTKILRELSGNGKKTATEIAVTLEIQVSAARKHLEALCSSGLVVQEFVKEGIGRPKKFYSLSELGRETFPRQYELVLNSMIEKLIASTDRSYVEFLLRKVAADLLQPKFLDVRSSGSDINFRDQIDRLSISLTKFGFDTSVEQAADGTIHFVSHNCPFYKAAKRFPDLMCQGLHGEIIRVALGTDKVKLVGCLLSGDSKCVHSVEQIPTDAL
jgi:DeoR family transcriptional regulator, suf operon transcriptional repressor